MRGAYTWTNTSVKKDGLICVGIYAGQGRSCTYRQINTVCVG